MSQADSQPEFSELPNWFSSSVYNVHKYSLHPGYNRSSLRSAGSSQRSGFRYSAAFRNVLSTQIPTHTHFGLVRLDRVHEKSLHPYPPTHRPTVFSRSMSYIGSLLQL